MGLPPNENPTDEPDGFTPAPNVKPELDGVDVDAEFPKILDPVLGPVAVVSAFAPKMLFEPNTDVTGFAVELALVEPNGEVVELEDPPNGEVVELEGPPNRGGFDALDPKIDVDVEEEGKEKGLGVDAFSVDGGVEN